MVKGCGPKIAKLTLLILNFAIWCCSVALLGLGIWMAVRASNFEDLFSEQNAAIVAYMMIGIGGLLFLIGFSGCCGAMRESTCLLNTYFAFMLLVVIAEAVAGILAFVYSSQIEEYMRIGMNETIAINYGKKTAATEAVDTVQENFECCGANDYTDYQYSAYMKEKNQSVPLTCCKSSDLCIFGTPGKPLSTLDIWQQGCVAASIDTVESNFVAVGAVCLVVLGVEVAAMIFSCCLSNSVEK